MLTLESVSQEFGKAQRALDARKGEEARLKRDLQAATTTLDEFTTKATLYERVMILLQKTSESGRQKATAKIDLMVTNALRSVFGPDYEFQVVLSERAGRPEADFTVVTPVGDQLLKADPQDAKGGGVVDVVSLGLRIAMLETYRPALEGALILDEPAKHVSEEFIQPVAQFLKTVSDVFGRQVIMVTHSAHLAETAEVAYQVELDGDRSVVKRIAGSVA